MNQVESIIKRLDSSFFLYDLDGFETHIKGIKEILHPDIKIWYACKANPLSKILKLLNENDFGVDVASSGELHQAKKSGVKKLIATGPAKTYQYLEELLDQNVQTIVIESINQLKDLNSICQFRSIKQDVLLRVQIEWQSEISSVLGGSSITPFGLGIDDWKKINLIDYKHINFKGLHCFQWGNVLKEEQILAYWEETIKCCKELTSHLGIDLQVLDLGGGLGLSYENDDEIDFKSLHQRLLKLKVAYGLNEIWLELGRYSIGKFGSYFTKIIDVKEVRGKNLIITEGGINHIARPALVGESFPCTAFNNQSHITKTVTVHGPLCTALDNLGTFELPLDVKVGDWLEFKRTGAYGFTESMPYFLCHKQAGEAFISKGDLTISREPSSAQDWLR